jgi:hypothetical protein
MMYIGLRYYMIYHQYQGDTDWTYDGVCENNAFVIRNAKANQMVKVRVVTVSEWNRRSTGTESGWFSITGKDVPPPPVAGFLARETLGGFILSWYSSPEPDIAGYDIWQDQNGAGITSCTKIADTLLSTTLFVPIDKAGNYIFYIAAKDNSSNVSDIVCITPEFSLPPTVQGFDVVRNGDNLEFRWQAPTTPGLQAEIRRGNSWGVGDRVYRGPGIACTYFFPVPGDHMFWIKWLDQRGNYSAEAAFKTLSIAQTKARNVLLTIDQVNSQTPWAGPKINCHESGGGLKLDSTAIRGEHVVEVDLPEEMAARNCVISNVVGTTGDEMTWGSANFTWDSPEANTAWIPDGDITTATVRHQMSRFVGFGSNVIESMPLDDTAVGEKNNTPPVESAGLSYQEARFKNGVFVSDATQLAWDIALPATFNAVFCARHSIDIVDNIVYMTISGSYGQLQIGYDNAASKFYLLDGQGNRNEVSLDHRTQDFITFGIVQTDTVRRFMVKSFSTDAVAVDERAFVPIGAMSRVALHPAA